MTNQLQGEILFAGWAGATAEKDWVHTPWIPVRGDYATFAVEVTFPGGATLQWDVQTRTRESATATSILAGTLPTGTASVQNDSAKPALELVRYRFNTGGTFSTTDFVVFRPLQPSWQVDR